MEAFTDDEELAEVLATRPEGKRRERLSDWSPEMEALVDMIDRLGIITSTLIAGFGGTPPRLRPYPRPITAMERARWRAQRARLERINDRLLGRDRDG